MSKTKLSKQTVSRLHKRKQWRQRAIQAATDFVSHPTGKPGRDEKAGELQKCMRKLTEWFGQRARAVQLAVQRRALR